MQTSEQFKQLITLYRLLGRPALIGNVFQTTVTCSPILSELLHALWLGKKYTIELTVDRTNYSSEMDEILPVLIGEQSLSIKLTVPQNEKGFYYKNVSVWVASAGALKKGRITANTYLIDEDLIIDDDEQGNTGVAKVQRICQLINQLSELAHYHDDKQGANSAYRLVFVVPDKDDKVYHPVILETQLTEDILQAEQPDISLLCNILQEYHISSNNIHASERLSVYRVALAEIIEKIPEDTKAFSYLVKHWPDVTESFNKSWERYLSGFSFNKLKTEMAKQQVEFSQKLSDIVASLSGRLFSLPVSVAGIVLLEKADSTLANWFYLLGSLLLSYMVFSSIKIQQENLENAKASYEMVFSGIDKEINEKTNSIQNELKTVVNRLNKTFSKLKCKLTFYGFIAWLPLLVAVIYIILKNDGLIQLVIEKIELLGVP